VKICVDLNLKYFISLILVISLRFDKESNPFRVHTEGTEYFRYEFVWFVVKIKNLITWYRAINFTEHKLE